MFTQDPRPVARKWQTIQVAFRRPRWKPRHPIKTATSSFNTRLSSKATAKAKIRNCSQSLGTWNNTNFPTEAILARWFEHMGKLCHYVLACFSQYVKISINVIHISWWGWSSYWKRPSAITLELEKLQVGNAEKKIYIFPKSAKQSVADPKYSKQSNDTSPSEPCSKTHWFTLLKMDALGMHHDDVAIAHGNCVWVCYIN